MIPTVVHRIWLGSPVPVEHDASWETWRRLFPDHELRTWIDEDVQALDPGPVYRAARTYAERADIARLLILDRFGGIYTDCDVEPLVRFDDLWTDDDRLVFFEFEPGSILNGVFAAAPGALMFMRALVARNAARHAPEAAPNVRTGPFAVDAALRYQLTRDPRGVRVYPPSFVDLRGGEKHAVFRTRFRDPPEWARVPGSATGPLARRDLPLELRLLPLRIRRRLRA